MSLSQPDNQAMLEVLSQESQGISRTANTFVKNRYGQSETKMKALFDGLTELEKAFHLLNVSITWCGLQDEMIVA